MIIGYLDPWGNWKYPHAMLGARSGFSSLHWLEMLDSLYYSSPAIEGIERAMKDGTFQGHAGMWRDTATGFVKAGVLEREAQSLLYMDDAVSGVTAPRLWSPWTKSKLKKPGPSIQSSLKLLS